MASSAPLTVKTPTKYVTLVSSDGFEFVVPREACLVSPVLKRMVVTDGGFIENQTGRMEMTSFR